MRKKEPLLPVLILGLLAFTVLWPLWFTVGGALMASDELTAALGPALLDTADGGYAVWTILPSWPTLQPLAELLLDTPQFFSAFWNTCLLAFAQMPVSWWSPPPHRGRLPSCALRAGVSCCSGTLR